VACPFFFPTVKSDSIAWAFPARLPLGSGYCGTCHAAGSEAVPAESELRDFCNLGYSDGCSRLPQERRADCVRFAVAVDNGATISLHYVLERDHAPVEHGRLEFNCESRVWAAQASDLVLQSQAEAYLKSYLERRRRVTEDSR
jgi:hypothetical protein